MTNEEERIFVGKLFDAHRPELMEIKHRAHEYCRRYNTLDERNPERQAIIRNLLGGMGESVTFQGPIQFNYGTHTFIGSHFFANFNLLVMDDGKITIGDHVMIGPNVSLLASNHPLIAEERKAIEYPDGHVSMSEFSKGIVIGAGSVVTHDVPAGWLAFGNPARPVREITEKDSKKNLL